MTDVARQTGSEQTSIRPVRVNFPEGELVELRRRMDATKRPERGTVNASVVRRLSWTSK
jgi:hypothetical protein